MPDDTKWVNHHRRMPEAVREALLDVEDRMMAELGIYPIPREGRGQMTDAESVGKLVAAWECLSASILLMTGEDFERHFGISNRRKK